MIYTFRRWAGLVAVATAITCDGGAGTRAPDSVPADAGPGMDTAVDSGPQSTGPRPKQPHLMGPERRILPGEFELLGLHQSGCSHGSGSGKSGGIWCAFSRKVGPAPAELWVLDLVQATSTTVACDGSSAACRKLSDEIFAGQPNTGGPVYPSSHRFYGDTLIYYGKSLMPPNQLFEGPVYAWKPGWPAPRLLTQRAVLCSGHIGADVASCIANISPDGAEPVTWDLHVGSTDRLPLARLAQIHPVHPRTMSSSWRASFTADGSHFAFSTTGPDGDDQETLFLIATGDIGAREPMPIAQPGISRWALSQDGSRWFYLRDFNYSVGGNPSGTLVTQVFPNGPSRVLSSTRIAAGPANGVAQFQLLRDATGADAGIAILQEVVDGGGKHVLLRDPDGDLDDPSNVIVVAEGPGGVAYSPDLQYAVTTAYPPDTGLRILRIDGSAPPCTLTDRAGASLGLSLSSVGLFGPAFSTGSGLVFWTENFDHRTQRADGWVASPAHCPTGKRRFAEGLDLAFQAGNDRLVYSHESDGRTVSLSHAPIELSGTHLGASVPIFSRYASRLFWVVPQYDAVIFKLAVDNPHLDGVYLRLLP